MDDKKASILVADDDKLIREVLKGILRDEGFRVVGEAKDGKATLRQLQKLNPDVVCLDVSMPDMSGLEVLKAILMAKPEAVVVMISGDASVATVRDAVGYGAAAFIIKPFRANHVGQTIRAALKAPSDSVFN